MDGCSRYNAAVFRSATTHDYDSFVGLFRVLDPAEQVPNHEWWTTSLEDVLFLDEGCAPVAFTMAYPLAEGLSHVSMVAVAEHARGRGVGRAIMEATRERLRTLGCHRWLLHVLRANTPALALYRRLGFVDRCRAEDLLLPPVDLPRSAVAISELSPDRDRDVERAFGIPAGRLQRNRRQPGRRILVAEDRGVAVFDVAKQSMPLCRATSHADAFALIAHVHAEGELRVMIEDDVPLAKALLAAGARTNRSLLYMEGPLR